MYWFSLLTFHSVSVQCMWAVLNQHQSAGSSLGAEQQRQLEKVLVDTCLLFQWEHEGTSQPRLWILRQEGRRLSLPCMTPVVCYLCNHGKRGNPSDSDSPSVLSSGHPYFLSLFPWMLEITWSLEPVLTEFHNPGKFLRIANLGSQCVLQSDGFPLLTYLYNSQATPG